MDWEPAFLLHSRAYRNTSLILDLLTKNSGRISAIVRSARGPQSRYRGRFQLFSPLLLLFSGERELKHIRQVEFVASIIDLKGMALSCGFYLNELLIRFLAREDPHPAIFTLYEEVLHRLRTEDQLEPILRYFEKLLLDHLGYGLPLMGEGLAIQAEKYYEYIPEKGFIIREESLSNALFSGKMLTALSRNDFTDLTMHGEMKN